MTKASVKRIILFAILGILLFIFIHQEYRPRKDEPLKEPLYPKVKQILQEKQQGERKPQSGRAVRGERERKKLLKVAESCDRQYARCMERCENSICEERCMKTLQQCEKDLPDDLKTLK